MEPVLNLSMSLRGYVGVLYFKKGINPCVCVFKKGIHPCVYFKKGIHSCVYLRKASIRVCL